MKYKMGSLSFQINGLEIKAVGRGFLVGLAGLVATYIPVFLAGVTYTITIHDKSIDLTPAVVVLSGVVVNFLRKYIADNSNKPA